jgi:hypothetical protein
MTYEQIAMLTFDGAEAKTRLVEAHHKLIEKDATITALTAQRDAQAAEIARLRRDHAALAKQLDITQRKLKGVTKLWHSDRAAALAQETQP